MGSHVVRGLQLAGIFLVLVASGISCAPGPQRAASTPIAGAPEVVITATEMRFAPNEVVLPASQVNVSLRNAGGLPHDLTIPGLGVYLVAQPGETVTTGLRDLPKGRYEGHCSIQGHADAGMRLSVNVE